MSPRPKRFRKMGRPPILRGFRPIGLFSMNDTGISIQYEEFEAFRLADYEHLSHEQAAKRMEVSRPTFTRIYEEVRKKIALAFVEGKSIHFEGGNVEFDKDWYRCAECHHVFHLEGEEPRVCQNCGSDRIENVNEGIRDRFSGRGYRRMKAFSGDVKCICPECGTSVAHEPGIPCRQMHCPDCQTLMIRLI